MNGGVLDEGLADAAVIVVVMMVMMIRAGHPVGRGPLEGHVLARGGFRGMLGARMQSRVSMIGEGAAGCSAVRESRSVRHGRGRGASPTHSRATEMTDAASAAAAMAAAATRSAAGMSASGAAARDAR